MQNRFGFSKAALLILAVSAASCASSEYVTYSQKAASPAPADPYGIVPVELFETHAALYRAWQDDQPAKLAPYFSSNAVVTTTTGYYRGWEAIESQWLAPLLRTTSGIFAKPASFTHEGEDIVERGTYHTSLLENGKMRPARGEYAQRWRRNPDGRWQVVSANIFAPRKQ